MIETEQSVVIAAPIGQVWDFAHRIENWAGLMPGLQDCDVVDADNSRWTLKVGAGGLVRTVKVNVHVDEWGGPESARFSYELKGDPVKGGGAYKAVRKGDGETEIFLHVTVEGSGPVAPMWEAMGKPLLPKLAQGFADQFKLKAEEHLGASDPSGEAGAERAPNLLERVAAWLLKPVRAIQGRSSA